MRERRYPTIKSMITRLERDVRECELRERRVRLLATRQRINGRKRGLLSAINVLRTYQREREQYLREKEARHVRR